MKIVLLVLTIFILVSCGSGNSGEADKFIKSRKKTDKKSSAQINTKDWPRYQGANGDGKSLGTAILRSWPAKGPKVLWENSLGEGFGGPSIRDKEVYLLDRIESKKDVLRCFDLESGKELWSKSFEVPGNLPYNGSRSTPTIGQKYVYAFGPFGHVYCVDRKTQEKVWSKNLVTAYSIKSVPHRWGFSQSPLLHKNKVIVAPCISKRVGLIAFNAKNGKELWNNKNKIFRGQTYVSPMVYNIAGVDQIWVMVRRIIAGVDPETGNILWQYKGYKNTIPIPNVTPLGGDCFFVTAGYRCGSTIIAITKSGEKYSVKSLMKIKDGAQIHPAIVIGEHLYVNFNENGKMKQNLSCIDFNGNIKWDTATGPQIDRGGMICVDNLLLVLGGQSGILHLIDPSPKGFKELAKAQIFEQKNGNNIWSPMAFSHGKLVLRDQTTIKCLDIEKQ